MPPRNDGCLLGPIYIIANMCVTLMAYIYLKAAGLSWKQRRDLWRTDEAKKEYRWDSYRYDGGLHYALKGTNSHNGNMLYAVAAGLNHGEIGRSFGNTQVSGAYTVIKKKYANNLNKGQTYGVWSLGE